MKNGQVQDVQMHVDAETQTITLSQKSSQFAIKPDKVTMPIMAFEMLYLNLRMQAINNVAKMQVKSDAAPNRASVTT